MVKVEDLKEEEPALRERRSQLARIAEENLSGRWHKLKIGESTLRGCFFIEHHSLFRHDIRMFVNSRANQVFVYDPAYFNSAYFLAEKYEAVTKEEFTVIEAYE